MNHDSTAASQHNAAPQNAAMHSEAPQHGAHTEEAEGQFSFKALFNEELGDHSGFNLFAFHIADLPYILYDKETGLNFYANPHALETAGVYELHHGHAVKKSDGSAPALDLSPTNFVVFQWISLLIVFVLFSIGNKRYKSDPAKAPKGIQNALEMMAVMIRDTVVRPNIPSERLVKSFLPYFLTIFFFIYTMNLIGLLPGAHTATSAIGTTAALAITAFIVVNILVPVKAMGAGEAFKSFAHHLLGGAPWWLFPIMVPIEFIGLFTKPFALCIRLFANMTSGHIVLLTLMGLIFFFKSLIVAPISVLFSIFIYSLELLVTFLQAYIFTMLTAVFTGLVLGDHVHEDHSHDAHAH
jgi:F-type H+-transporting ATPase subunit a